MDYQLHKTFWLVLIIGVATVQGMSKLPMNYQDDENDYSIDSDYQNDEEDGRDEEAGTSLPSMMETPPEITSKSKNLVVPEGSDVVLPCDVLNKGNSVLMWKNGTKGVWIDGIPMVKDSRRQFNDTTLIIKKAQTYDSGQYSCVLTGLKSLSLNYTLEVVPARKLFITQMQPEVPPGQSKILKKGDSLTLACEANGYPPPKVYWVRRGRKHFPNGHERMEGTSITFEEVDRKYSGIYECEVSNEFESIRKSVEIRVHYPPEIEIEEETVTTSVGLQPEITCTVHAEPKADVTWYRNGGVVENSDRISMTVINNKYTLQITRMNKNDFGSYTCYARNELGSQQKAITLSGAPTRPKIEEGFSEHKKSPEITWMVESYSPIIEYEFQIKNVQDGMWMKITPTQKVINEGNTYKSKEILSNLSPSDYQVRVRAKNSHGWSPYKEEKIFIREKTAAESTNNGAKLGANTIVQILVFSYVLFM